MDAKHFLNYIKKPSLLHQISYEELKAIVLQYPFNSNLRYLLLIKSKFVNHEDYNKNLAIAAGYSVDRTFLYQLLQDEELLAIPQQEELLEEEDILVLKDLGEIEAEIEMAILPNEIENEAENLGERAGNLTLPITSVPIGKTILSEETPTEFPSESKITTEKKESSGTIAPKTEDKAPDEAEHKLLDAMHSLNALIENAIDSKNEVDDKSGTLISLEDIAKITSLTDKVKQMLPEEKTENTEEKTENVEKQEKRTLKKKDTTKTPVKETIDKEIASKPKIKKRSLKKAKEMAAKSIQSKNSVASETLAILLSKQGLYENAIKMYEQLILAFPEKKSYFVDKITNLKNKN